MATKATYVTLREAAASLGVHENTVRRYADRGLIRATRLPSGVRRLRRADVETMRRRTNGRLDPGHSALVNPDTTIVALAAAQNIGPLQSASELVDLDVWTSDEEVDLFNAAVRVERDSDR